MELLAVPFRERNVLPDDVHAAFRDRQEPDGGPADGGLARAGFTHKSDNLARVNHQVCTFDRAERRDPPLLGVFDGNIPQLKDRFAFRLRGFLGRSLECFRVLPFAACQFLRVH